MLAAHGVHGLSAGYKMQGCALALSWLAIIVSHQGMATKQRLLVTAYCVDRCSCHKCQSDLEGLPEHGIIIFHIVQHQQVIDLQQIAKLLINLL